MKVLIPTLKRTDHSKGCVYKGVLSYLVSFDKKPHDDILKSAYYGYEVEKSPIGVLKPLTEKVKEGEDLLSLTYPACLVISAEVIDEQHHYAGKKLEWLKEHSIARPAGNFLLSGEDGGIFINAQ